MAAHEAPVCRVCWEAAIEGPGVLADVLVQPCDCRGSQAHVHCYCLFRWQQLGGQFSCGVCGQRYRLTPEYHGAVERLVAAGELERGQVEVVHVARGTNALRRRLGRLLGWAAHSAFWGYQRLLILGQQLDMLQQARLLRPLVAAQPALLQPYAPLWHTAVWARLLVLGTASAFFRGQPELERGKRRLLREILCSLGGAAVLGAGIWLERRTSSGGGRADGGSVGAAAAAVAGLGRALTGAGLFLSAWMLGDAEGTCCHTSLLIRPWHWLHAREVLAQAWAPVLQRCFEWPAGSLKEG